MAGPRERRRRRAPEQVQRRSVHTPHTAIRLVAGEARAIWATATTPSGYPSTPQTTLRRPNELKITDMWRTTSDLCPSISSVRERLASVKLLYVDLPWRAARREVREPVRPAAAGHGSAEPARTHLTATHRSVASTPTQTSDDAIITPPPGGHVVPVHGCRLPDGSDLARRCRY